jgi:hypothetical protein
MTSCGNLCSLTCLSVRSPRKTGRRSWSSLVHSVNLIWATKTGSTQWRRFMTAGANASRPARGWGQAFVFSQEIPARSKV